MVKKSKTKTSAKIIRQYAEPLLRNVEHVEISSITNQIVPQLFDDETFMNLLHTNVRSMTVQVIRDMVAQTRGLMPMGNEIISTHEFSRRAKTLSSKFANWMEHAGDKHHLLRVMTKEDFLHAAEEREERGHAEFTVAGLWRSVAAQLEPGQSPVERWGDDWESEIQRLAREISDDLLDIDG